MTASGTTVYPGIYKARCTADNGQFLTAFVPQVFGVQPITVSDMTGARPVPGSMGYIAFEGGDTAFPVWISAGGSVAPASAGATGVPAPPASVLMASLRVIFHSVGYQGIDYTISTSTDLTTWTAVASVTGNTSTDVTTGFDSTTARYIKVEVTARTSDGVDTFAHLAILELEVPAVTLSAVSPDTPYDDGVNPIRSADQAVDGNLLTWWQPVAGTTTPTIIVDRGVAT